VSLIRKDRGKKLKPSDAPWLASYALILRRAAADALAPELLRSGEYLPLSCAEAELVIVNPWNLDALDENASSVQRFGDGGIIRIARHVFLPDRLEGVSAFKLPNLRVSPTFVGERVVALWRQSRLRGLVFKQVWDSGQP
jgi:hypothetical protein